VNHLPFFSYLPCQSLSRTLFKVLFGNHLQSFNFYFTLPSVGILTQTFLTICYQNQVLYIHQKPLIRYLFQGIQKPITASFHYFHVSPEGKGMVLDIAPLNNVQ